VDDYSRQQRQLVSRLRERLKSNGATRATVVPIQSDYVADRAFCLTSVAFPPRDVARRIEREFIAPLRAVEPRHYFYPRESFHVTIKNVQVVHDPPTFSEPDAEQVSRMLHDRVPRHRAFSFQVGDLLTFPSSVSLIGYCDARLAHLIEDLDRGLSEINLPDNKRYVSDTIFFGNLTLCRFVEPPSDRLLDAIESLGRDTLPETNLMLPVEELTLISCNAVCHPDSRRIYGSYRLSD
jgi:2'-5' RNA ligase